MCDKNAGAHSAQYTINYTAGEGEGEKLNQRERARW